MGRPYFQITLVCDARSSQFVALNMLCVAAADSGAVDACDRGMAMGFATADQTATCCYLAIYSGDPCNYRQLMHADALHAVT